MKLADVFSIATMVGRLAKRAKSTTPRNNRQPHQGAREVARRKRQIERGILQCTPEHPQPAPFARGIHDRGTIQIEFVVGAEP